MSSVIEEKGEFLLRYIVYCLYSLYVESELTTIKRMNKTAFSQLDKLKNILKTKGELCYKNKWKNHAYI